MRKVEKEKVYRIEGEYIESCNCDAVCPCLLNAVGNNEVPATYKHCDLILGYSIDKGHYKDLDLAGLNFAWAIYSPGPLMKVPNWSVAYYIDERATDEQFEAIKQIITGEAGGMPAGVKALREEILGVVKTKVEINVRDKEREVTIGDIGHATVKAVTGLVTPEDEDVIELTNCHPQTQNGDCILAMGDRAVFRDYGFSFNNTGRSAVYGRYIWQENCPIGCPE